ncbi:MAG: YbjQ family protein [Gammaproteobacteria bacterium]|nr:MAG: YbjQ family protein [Gammaproteobacteria bacterium]
MLITTTDVLQNKEILEYKGVITSSDVRAVNVVRNFFTSFRDIFGGRSGSYQDVMKDIEKELLRELSKKAENMGCNAIIGLTIDFDNVGSKNKSLIMGYAKATGVILNSDS